MHQPTIELKRGNTLMLGWQALDAQGAPVPLNGVAINAIARQHDGQQIAVMEVEFIDASQGRFEVWAPGNGRTTSWPGGDVYLELEYSETLPGGRVMARSTRSLVAKVLP